MTYQAVKVEDLVAVVDDLGVLLGQPPGPSADGRRERGDEARDEKEELGDVESEDVGHEGRGGLSRLDVSACVAARTGDCPIAEDQGEATTYLICPVRSPNDDALAVGIPPQPDVLRARLDLVQMLEDIV